MEAVKNKLQVWVLEMGAHSVACPGDGCFSVEGRTEGKREE